MEETVENVVGLRERSDDGAAGHEGDGQYEMVADGRRGHEESEGMVELE